MFRIITTLTSDRNIHAVRVTDVAMTAFSASILETGRFQIPDKVPYFRRH